MKKQGSGVDGEGKAGCSTQRSATKTNARS